MRAFLTGLLAVLTATIMAARVQHIDGLLDVQWKQKGAQPIPLTVYDETVSVEWPPVIEDAVHLWDASSAFQMNYVRGQAPSDYPPAVGTVRVIERINPHDQGFIIPNAQGIVSWWTVELNPPSLITTANGWTVLQVMQKEARHELGHVLTLNEHNIQFVDAPWGGGAEPGCSMANGIEVTAFDLGLLCQRYSCR